MATVGIRELKEHLSEYLRRVREGELVVITDRGRPVGRLGPAEAGAGHERARLLTRQGRARWEGGKPRGLSPAPRPRKGLVSVAVLEDRR